LKNINLDIKMSVLPIPQNRYNKKPDPSIFIEGRSIVDNLKNADMWFCGLDQKTYRRKTIDFYYKLPYTGLNETYALVDYVPGLKTTLFPHQKTVVRAMLDLEFARIINDVNKREIQYNAAILSEPVGSGKTIDVLALLCLSSVPRVLPDIAHFPLYNCIIKKKFKKFLRPALVFVGVSVMNQWKRAIADFTNLSVLEINNILDLRPMLNMLIDGSINQYDIVLVKNGKITVPIVLPGDVPLEKKNAKTTAYFYNIIANYRNYCWSRVIIDDFDTIGLPHNAGIINGIFTWYISSTRKKQVGRTVKSLNGNTTEEILSKYDYGCSNIMSNHVLFLYLNVRNKTEFIMETTKIPNIKYWVAVFTNPHNTYISLLGSINDNEINRITEMLNGDAIGEAAEAAGIKSTNVADIFQKILGDKYEKYMFAGDLLAFIDDALDNSDNWEEAEKTQKYGKKNLLEFQPIEYKYPGIKTLLKDTQEEYKQIHETNGIAIERVKANIRHGKCPACREDLEDVESTAITRCCGSVLCGECGIKMQNLNDRYKKLRGRCSNCRKEITIKDLIYIENFDLNKISNEEIESSDEESDEEKEQSKKEQNKKEATKYTAIVDIIKGNPVPNSKRVDMHLPNMMKGSAYLAEAPVRKVLVFANYSETLDKVVEELKEEKIHYWRLMGTANDIDKISSDFTKCQTTCALVINSTKHCSGLNLQTATDLVFTHTIIDQAVESQVAGRGHRLGRTTPLNIWYLQYDSEATQLYQSHGIRDMSREEITDEMNHLQSTTQGLTKIGNSQTQTQAEETYKKHRYEVNAPANANINANANVNVDASDYEADYSDEELEESEESDY